MEVKDKVCRNPECDNTFTPFKSTDKYCSAKCFFACQKPKEQTVRPAKPIARRSDKRAEEERVYNQLRKIFLSDPKNKTCPVTKKPATEVHHKKGRVGKLLLDVRYWLAVSRDGHRWIEEHPDEAKELGYSLSRLEKDGKEEGR